jgi:predicted heme/steroid binding protein
MKKVRFCIPYAVILLLATVDDAVPAKVRIVTREELARHDGNKTQELWLAIMSKVYDVSAGKEYYAPGSPYSIFSGRDGNVPFITGAFNPEEAEKPLTDMTPHQLMNLETWAEFYEKEEKYPYIGLLEGDLYDKDGNPTEMMSKVQEMIKEAKVAVADQKKKTAEVLERRRREDAQKKKKKNVGDHKPTATPNQPKGVIVEPLEEKSKEL